MRLAGITFGDPERAPHQEAMVNKANAAIKSGAMFYIQLSRRKQYFAPDKLTSADESGNTFTYNNADDMMTEIAGLLFVAKDIVILRKVFSNG